MDDLISRQAAIDAVKKNTFRLTFAEEQNYEGHVAWSANAVYSDVIEGALLELPSAQQKVIHCADCNYRNKYRFPPKYEERDYCEKHEKVVQTDWYCSWAERRQE